jgi:hypothetical protein
MSDHLPDPESSGGRAIDDGHTEEHPTVTETLATPLDGPGWLAGDDADESDEQWVSQTTHGIRLAVPAAALLAVVLVAGGFWAGAALQKSQGGSSSAVAGVAARFRSAAGAGATGGSAASRFGGLFASSAGTAGTISVVDGNTLYVNDTATGSIVKVTLTKSTTITRNADAAGIDLRPGDTVTVQGATGTSGAVTATSVAATAPGVTSGFAGFGGFGGAGTGASTSTSTTGSNTTTTPALFGSG